MKKFEKPDAAHILKGLKDFQRKTVDYVYQRLYVDVDRVNKFLIADEVGLGKTLIARGVIAKAVEKLWDEVKRIDIIYICSNTDIARQNINRLNITKNRDFSLASRMTLLPIHLKEFQKNKLNFVSFTPGTSFDLRSRGGVVHERALLYNLLREGLEFGDEPGPRNIFQGDVNKDNWRSYIADYRQTLSTIDSGIKKHFIEAVTGDKEFQKEFKELRELFSHYRIHIPNNERSKQFAFIGKARKLLAEVCIAELEPDIIILDEFQRFKNLLDGEDEVAEMAQKLFNYKNKETDAKLMLLSATPYKMYTMYHETEDDDHYEDFYRTIDFLFEEKDSLEGFKQHLNVYRDELYNFGETDNGGLETAKKNVQKYLKKVMVRTERLSVSNDRNGMVFETNSDLGYVSPRDLRSFSLVDRISELIGTHDALEYWKAAPYILNIMDRSGYKIKEKFVDNIESNIKPKTFYDLFDKYKNNLLSWDTIRSYQPVDPGAVKMRTLMRNTLDKCMWKLLWIPASHPYYTSSHGPYADPLLKDVTKSLIFSSWRVVPKVIAQLCSYEAERSILIGSDKRYEYDEEARKRRPLLNFTRSDGRLTGMSNFTLMYPSMTLATKIDPMCLPLELSNGSESMNVDLLLKSVADQISELLKPLIRKYGKGRGQTSERWYWAAPVLLDRYYYWKEYLAWLESEDEDIKWSMTEGQDDEDDEGLFYEHVEQLYKHFDRKESELLFIELGPPPPDLPLVLAKIALASPAVVALRSMLRHCNIRNIGSYINHLLTSAAQTAIGFRTLLNIPYAMAVVQQYSTQDYWHAVLDYCLNGNLQAVMDEYAHILRESLGLIDADERDIVTSMSEEMYTALSIRTVNLSFDEIKLNKDAKIVELTPHTFRCRFALRFDDSKDEEDGITRSDQVRKAFNSPFHPFILATTSKGQEGLDFHQYCHDVYHWNLPSNPVDMEQREGRVHRYKGHAVRRNVANSVPLFTIKDSIKALSDPWYNMFETCRKRRSAEDNDLIPYWISDNTNCDNKYRICRHVPALPLSREIIQLDSLRRSLVAYRMVFGQPRQEDLVKYLENKAENNEINLEQLLNYRIDLSPEG